ncbi:MAG: hypothetical protein AABY22_31960 [Nanoarchaeota archaeon]
MIGLLTESQINQMKNGNLDYVRMGMIYNKNFIKRLRAKDGDYVGFADEENLPVIWVFKVMGS